MLKLRKLGDDQGQKAPRKATGKTGLKPEEKKKMDAKEAGKAYLETEKLPAGLMCFAQLLESQ